MIVKGSSVWGGSAKSVAMSVKIGSNIASLVSQRRLGEATDSLSRVYERLSSGQRINRASDDAAGLAIADSLNAKSKIYTQAIRNGNDGISLLNIADSAVSALSDVVIRIRELSEQAANGSYSSKQREAIDAEAQQLSKEFTRITQTTSFNNINIFSSSLGNGLQLQLGDGTEGALNALIGGAIGTGQFSSTTVYSSTASNIFSSVLGDLNNDGILDIVSAGNNARLEVRLGLGDGTFGAATLYTTGSASNWFVTLGDVNNDGILDAVSSGDNNRVEVRLGLGNGNFGTAVTYSTAAGTNYSVTLSDINNDGNLDFVASGSNNNIEIRLGTGDGKFGTSNLVTTVNSINFNSQFGDLNGDGILDMVTSGNGSALMTRLGVGDGTFGAATTYTAASVINFSLALGDLNNDGILDIAIGGGTNAAEVRFGQSNGTFSSAVIYSLSGQVRNIKFGDINGDGILDMIAGQSNNRVGVRLGTGNGSFGDAIITSTGSSSNYSVSLGDINGDGVLDLVSSGSSIETKTAVTKNGLGAISQFSLKTRSDSLQAIRILDQSIANLAKQRGTIGASLSRVSVAISNLQSSAENFKAAESRIRDTDIASDSAQLIRTQILQQAASSVLAQANQAPALALKLLSN